MRQDPQALTRAEAEALLKACGMSWTGRRNRALITLGYRAGLRVSEALYVRRLDLTRRPGGGMVVRVARPKGYERGAKPRSVGLDPKAAAIVDVWLEEAGSSPGIYTGTSPVFVTHSGARVLSSYVRSLMARLGRRAAIARRVHFHGLRHTFAHELYSETHDVMLLMRALGHRKLDTTHTYLETLGVEVVEATEGRVW